MSLAKVYELFSYPDAGLTTSLKKIKDRPNQLKRVIRAGIKANCFIRREREGTIQFLMEWQKVNRETAALTMIPSAKYLAMTEGCRKKASDSSSKRQKDRQGRP
jgi:hypothetical protein